MWTPWRGKAGIPKAVAILATVLLISLGLCGANAFAVVRWAWDPGPDNPRKWLHTFLGVTAWAELIATGGSLAALIILFVARAVSSARRPATNDKDPL